MFSLQSISFTLAASVVSLLPVLSSSVLASTLSIHLDSIHSLGLPVITIETVDGEEPTCERADPPEEEGAVGMGITNATKVPGRLCITLGGDTLYDSGPYVKGASGMRVKIRGNSSAWTPKKPYKVMLERKADLLLRGDEERYADRDWVLLKDPLFRLHMASTCYASPWSATRTAASSRRRAVSSPSPIPTGGSIRSAFRPP